MITLFPKFLSITDVNNNLQSLEAAVVNNFPTDYVYYFDYRGNKRDIPPVDKETRCYMSGESAVRHFYEYFASFKQPVYPVKSGTSLIYADRMICEGEHNSYKNYEVHHTSLLVNEFLIYRALPINLRLAIDGYNSLYITASCLLALLTGKCYMPDFLSSRKLFDAVTNKYIVCKNVYEKEWKKYIDSQPSGFSIIHLPCARIPSYVVNWFYSVDFSSPVNDRNDKNSEDKARYIITLEKSEPEVFANILALKFEIISLKNNILIVEGPNYEMSNLREIEGVKIVC